MIAQVSGRWTPRAAAGCGRSLFRLKQSATGRDLEDWFAAEAEIRASDAARAPWVEEEA